MSHNPGYRQPQAGWTDHGIEHTEPQTLHDRILAVMHDVDGMQIQLDRAKASNKDLREALSNAIMGLKHFAYADTPSQKDELAALQTELNDVLQRTK